jgi:hypothetical protein
VRYFKNVKKKKKKRRVKPKLPIDGDTSRLRGAWCVVDIHSVNLQYGVAAS